MNTNQVVLHSLGVNLAGTKGIALVNGPKKQTFDFLNDNLPKHFDRYPYKQNELYEGNSFSVL